jgi:hypothetical protein
VSNAVSGSESDQVNYLYRSCGLTIQSGLVIPELPPGGGSVAPDLVIGFDQVPSRLDAPTIRGALYEADAEQCLVIAPGVARYLVTGGTQIRIDAAPGAADQAVRLFLLGAALGLALTQRGMLALHASVAVHPGGGALVFSGHSGRGKSTLLASLVSLGFGMLGDDLAVLVPAAGGGIEVEPVFPRIKLKADAARRMGLDPETLSPVRPGVAKYQWPTEPRYVSTRQTLRAIYLLEYGSTLEITRQPVVGGDRLAAVRPYVYGLKFAEHAGYHVTQFPAFAAAVTQVPVIRLVRPPHARVEDVVRMVMDEGAR